MFYKCETVVVAVHNFLIGGVAISFALGLNYAENNNAKAVSSYFRVNNSKVFKLWKVVLSQAEAVEREKDREREKKRERERVCSAPGLCTSCRIC